VGHSHFFAARQNACLQHHFKRELEDEPLAAAVPPRDKARRCAQQRSRRGGDALSGFDLREKMRVAAIVAARAARALGRKARAPYDAARSMAFDVPERLYIAPQDIRAADPTVANEIYAGYFSFDGKTINAQGRSPFAVIPPSDAWRRSLAGFSWLRHLRAADKALARVNAQALVSDFMSIRKIDKTDPAFEPGVVARRTLSWLAHSPLLLEEADEDFYRRFMASLARGVRRLARALDGKTSGKERLYCAIAIAEFAICANVSRIAQMRATRLLAAELKRQILSDGGHIGRNPQTMVDVLLELLPLRQLYAARGIRPPQILLSAIDRMTPMLRMMRHGDGSLALFNGMGVTAQGRLATVLAYEEQIGAAPLNAPYSGYQRLENRATCVIVDAGRPPPSEFSRAAHAGCLSFEFSIGAERVVVNCGVAKLQDASLRSFARGTSAHSTLTLDDRSSCRIAGAKGIQKYVAGRILSGPTKVRVDRRRSNAGDVLALSHDGYVRDFGLIHERKLKLSHDGLRLSGEDRLVAAPGSFPGAIAFSLRFHLHPKAHADIAQDGETVQISLASGERVTFRAAGGHVAIEESVFFAAPEGPCKCAQIVVSGPAKPDTKIRWSFQAWSAHAAGPPVSSAPDV
jgi:uncharacterized heparinase superfamily protein